MRIILKNRKGKKVLKKNISTAQGLVGYSEKTKKKRKGMTLESQRRRNRGGAGDGGMVDSKEH